MPLEKFDIVYSDINIDAGTYPVEKVLNADSLNQNIINIIDTPYESKWFRPELGCDVNKYLFEPVDDVTASKIQQELIDALASNGEFRVEFTSVEVLADPSNAQFFVSISYKAPVLDDHEHSFNFNLARGFS